MPNPEFIGREAELAQLRTYLAAAADRQPETVIVQGEAGVGKTELIKKFVSQVSQSDRHVLAGACIELGDGIVPYAPLIEALRLFVRFQGEDALRAYAGPAWPEISGLIADFTGAPRPPRPVGVGSQLHVYGAVMQLLDRLGEDEPVVLIFEDLHWADQSTLDLVAFLTRAKSNERLLLIGSMRSDLKPDDPLRVRLAQPDFNKRIKRVDVHPFGETDLRRLLRSLGATGVDVAARCFDLSEGNPFFADQLIVSGVLAAGGSSALPESVDELMRSRIQPLSDAAKHVIRVAATAGRRVSDRLLTAVSGVEEPMLEAGLRECINTGMLIRDPAFRDSYLFRHALLREAVHEDMLVRERRRLHTAMAQAITADITLSLAGDLTAAAELAYHWDEADDHQREALAASVQAGQASGRIRAFHEAERHYRRALRLWSEVPDPVAITGVTKVDALLALADAARWAGHSANAVEYVLTALAEVDVQRDPDLAGALYERLGSYQWEAGAGAGSVEAYETAWRLIEGRPPSGVHADVLAGLAMGKVRDGRYEEAKSKATKALEIATAVGALGEVGRAENAKGLALSLLGKADQGLPLLFEAIEITRQTEHLEGLLRTYANLGVALEHNSRLSESVAIAREGLTLAGQLGLTDSRCGRLLANNASAALYLLGRWDEAIDLLDVALLDDPPVRESLYLRLTLAEIEVGRGMFAQAEELIVKVRELPNADPRFLAALETCVAELALWRGMPKEALAAVQRASGVNDRDNTLMKLRLLAVGLRAIADMCASGIERETMLDEGDHLLARMQRIPAAERMSPEVRALERLCVAEHRRARRRDTAGDWNEVAAGWTQLERPYPAAYARWREAATGSDVDRAQAAVAAAEALGADPLREAASKLLAPDAVDASATQVDPLRRLTKREKEVLLLLEDHRSPEIARMLVIAQATVTVHLHNIYRKLGVPGRTEAVLYARDRGFYQVD